MLSLPRARIAALVARALRRRLCRIAAALRLASRLAAVVALATYQRAAATAWRWHRVAASNVGKDSRRRTDKQENAPYNRRRVIAA